MNRCRCCFKNIEEYTKINNLMDTPELAEKYYSCTSLKLDANDEYPKYICDYCAKQLDAFYQFHLMCRESAEHFCVVSQWKKKVLARMIIDDEQANYDLNQDSKQNIIVKVFEELPIVKEKKRGRPKNTVKFNKKNRLTSEEKLINGKNLEDSANDCGRPKKTVKFNKKNRKTSEEKLINGKNLEDSANDCNNRIRTLKQGQEPILPRVSKNSKQPHKANSKNEQNNKIPTEPIPITNKAFHCEKCPARFFVKHRLQAHIRKHEGLIPYPCSLENCQRAFQTWNALAEHMKEHEGSTSWYSCKEAGCNRVYKHKPTLVMHMRRFHKYGPEPKLHVCEICGKVFKSSPILNDHSYTHKDKSELPYACDKDDCKHRFSNKEKLKVHMMRHAGIKNYVCPYCGMRKTTRNELNVHINYHTLERTWPCRFCTKVCNSGGNLKMHVRTVHEQAKDYACRFCKRTFAKSDTRKYHEMTHTGEKPHECKECGKRFTQPAALRTHRKIHLRQNTISQNATTTPPLQPPILDPIHSPNNTATEVIRNEEQIQNETAPAQTELKALTIKANFQQSLSDEQKA